MSENRKQEQEVFEDETSSLPSEYEVIDFKDEQVQLINKKISRKIDFRLVLVFSIAYIFTQIDKTNISNAAILNLESGDGIKQKLGNLNSQQWAWCLSIFYYPYLFFEPISTILMKRFGPRVWQSRIMISWGIVSMLQASAFNYSGLLATRFFLGLFEAGFYPSVLYQFGFWLPTNRLRLRIAFFYSWGMISSAISGILAFGISHLNRKANLYGWQWVFIIEGIPTILLGIYVFFFLPNYPQDAKFLDEYEKKVLLAQLPKSAPTSSSKTFSWNELKPLFKDPTFYTYSLFWLFQGVGGWGISYVLPTIIYQLGFTDTAKTQLMNIPPSVAGFILLNVLGYFLQKKKIGAFPTAAVLSLIQLSCYIVLVTINNNVGKYLMLIIATAISNSLFPILWPDRIRVVRGTTQAGFAIGFTNAVTQTMGLVGPQVYQPKFGPGYRVSYGCSIGFCSIAVANLFATWYFVHKRGIIDAEGADIEEVEQIRIVHVEKK